MTREWIALGMCYVGTIASCTSAATEREKSPAKADAAPARDQVAAETVAARERSSRHGARRATRGRSARSTHSASSAKPVGADRRC
jgi:hypothetical protein